MQARDWISGLVGLVVFLLGLVPFMSARGNPLFGIEFTLPVALMSWALALGGFYLIVNSFVEITNSNVVGWISFFTAAAIAAVGVLSVLGNFGMVSGFLAMEWVPELMFQVLFMVLGVFLMIATFAMEL